VSFDPERDLHAKAEAAYLSVGVCPHLRPVAEFLRQQGMRITSFGQAWSRNCRNWVYFDGVIDVDSLRRSLSLGECVSIHRHRGTHDGSEQGFVCGLCNDGVMGRIP